MHANQHQAWPPAHDKILRDMADRGCTSSEIAVSLGRTRNSVIGRATRMKIVWKSRSSPRKKKLRPKSNIRNKLILSLQGGAKKQVFVEHRKPMMVINNGKSLLLATYRDCRWPLDARGSDGMPRVCGVKCEGTYCSEHKRITALVRK